MSTSNFFMFVTLSVSITSSVMMSAKWNEQNNAGLCFKNVFQRSNSSSVWLCRLSQIRTSCRGRSSPASPEVQTTQCSETLLLSSFNVLRSCRWKHITAPLKTCRRATAGWKHSNVPLISNWVTLTVKPSVSRLLPDACFLQQDQGGCQEYTMVWFYDTKQNECSRFWYGGCGGNENRFTTQEECEHLCVTKSRWGRGGRRHRRESPLYTEHVSAEPSGTRIFKEQYKILSSWNPSTAESFWNGSTVHRFLLKRLQGNWNRSRTQLLVEDILFLSWTCVFSFLAAPSFCESFFKQTINISQ